MKLILLKKANLIFNLLIARLTHLFLKFYLINIFNNNTFEIDKFIKTCISKRI